MGTLIQDAAEVASCATAIDNAIVAKGGTLVGGGKLRNAAAGIAAIPSGSSTEVFVKDVTFYDYDGTPLYSYTKAEAQALTALPTYNPRTGFTFQGWTHTLAEVNAVDEFLDILPFVKRTDGSTRVVIVIGSDESDKSMIFKFSQSVANGVSVNWGDGTAAMTYSHTSMTEVSHTYASGGTYEVTFTRVSSSVTFDFAQGMSNNGGSPYSVSTKNLNSRIVEVNLGDGYTSIGTKISCLPSLQILTVHNGITYCGDQFACKCPKLLTVIVPPTNGNSPNFVCYDLGASVIVIDRGMATIGANFLGTGGIEAGVQKVNRIALPPNLSVSLHNKCRLLTRVAVPHTAAMTDLFYCFYLRHVKIPSTVTSIPAQCFCGTYCCLCYDFRESTAIPSLANVSAFQGTNNNKQIVVPDALYDEWIAATNWSDSSIVGYIVKASDYEA